MRSFRSIHNRIFLLFLASMLSLLLVVSVLYYQRATEQIRNRISDIGGKNISQTVGLFDLLLKGYDSVTKTLNSNDELMRLLQSRLTDDPELGVNNERRIRNILGAIFYSRDDIVGIHIVTYSGNVHSYERASGSSSANYAQTPWFHSLKKSTGEMRWLGVYPQSLMSGGFDRPVFAFGRQLFELNELKPIGIVLIETDAKAILSALSNASLGPGSTVSILGAAGETIVTTPGENSFEPLPADWPGKLRTGETFIRERPDSLVTAARIGLADWTIVAQTPKSNVQLELKQTQQFLLTVVLVLVVVATILASFVSRTFSSPFKRLLQEMKQVEMGNFNGSINVNSYEEINVLVSSFNRMVARMDELIERIKLSSISEKNAQLQALQSQVNPHFLFNTLDMIYWMLDERENDRLGRVILALSNIFRYSSDWEEASRSTLRSELAQMQHYLTIIETRLAGRISTRIEFEDRWLDAGLPKMTLQPIIENAVKYGLEPLNRPGQLSVYTQESAGLLNIVIEDNGAGMDDDQLEQLVNQLHEEDHADAASNRARRGIGLQNVHRRIRLMYGNAFGLRISSSQEKGTTVIVAMPLPAPGGEQL